MRMLRYVVEKNKIANNIRMLEQRVQSRRIYAVLKADGYGMGCQRMASVCSENQLTYFAVTTLEDAEAVMAAGVPVKELLFLSSAAPEDIPRLVELGVTFTVASEADALALLPYHARVHIKVDTGMGRRGVYFNQASDIADLYMRYPNLQFVGIYTHFADALNRKRTQRQFSRFQSVLQYLQDRQIDVGIRHCCSSSTVFLYDDMLLDAVRVGSALLGRVIDYPRYGIQRTGVCYVPIEAVRTLRKGATVSYGSAYQAEKDMQVAVCTVGTHHGFGLSVLCGKQKLWMELIDVLRYIRKYRLR